MIELTEQDLLLRLRNFEDHFVERKTSLDSKDWLKTVVAFANSTPMDFPAVLFIGAKDDGTPEDRQVNLDSLQKTFGEKVSEAYPPIYYASKVVVVDGKQVLAVIIPGSGERPHFAGPSYIREGSETKRASEKQFETLIAQRSSKAYEILRWKNRPITVDLLKVDRSGMLGRVASSQERTVVNCNQFYVTLDHSANLESLTLDRIRISFDNEQNRLKLEVHPM